VKIRLSPLFPGLPSPYICYQTNFSMNQKQHILIVDDCRTNLVLLKEVLSDEYQVSNFLDPLKALESFISGSYDLIISDFMMPEMSGIELLEKVRQANSYVPFLIITANTDEQHEKSAYQAGVDEYLYKPVSIVNLINSVKTLLNNKTLKCK